MRLVGRYPVSLVLIALILWSAATPLPSLLDAVTGAPAPDADLVRPASYVAIAPVSNVLDALTFLGLDRARALLLSWAAALALVGALRAGSVGRRALGAALGVLWVLAAVVATVFLPRPVPRLVVDDPALTVIDYHAHTRASHDGRRDWTDGDLARWHAAQGFEATYVTDHNRVFDGTSEDQPVALLPGAEWSVNGQHLLALGETAPIDPGRFNRDLPALLALFPELHKQGALAIASIPEYWRAHWNDLDAFVRAGIDGFEIVNCAPKAIVFPPAARARVVALAKAHNLLLTGGSDNHGWGKVTCVWNLARPSAHGFAANRVIARPIALLQSDHHVWTAGYDQAWLMFRGLTWPERVSWLTWILVLGIYRAVPRRAGDGGGLGILARSLKLRLLRRPEPAGS
ncbi:MAG TPA: hypothetical protein VLT79_04535 [Gemmatimonadales bacterium]|nr:hypothetical protein [Gemmatimonadales bacterium]